MKKPLLFSLIALLGTMLILIPSVAVASDNNLVRVKSESNNIIVSSNNFNNSILDEENVISDNDEQSLNNKILDIWEKHDIVISIVTTSRMDGLNALEYATKRANDMELGDSNKNNGVLIAVSMKENQVGITVGKGISKNILSQKVVDQIIEETLIPSLRDNKPTKGLSDALNEIDNAYRGEGVTSDDKDSGFPIFGAIIAAIVLVGSFVTKFFKKDNDTQENRNYNRNNRRQSNFNENSNNGGKFRGRGSSGSWSQHSSHWELLRKLN